MERESAAKKPRVESWKCAFQKLKRDRVENLLVVKDEVDDDSFMGYVKTALALENDISNDRHAILEEWTSFVKDQTNNVVELLRKNEDEKYFKRCNSSGGDDFRVVILEENIAELKFVAKRLILAGWKKYKTAETMTVEETIRKLSESDDKSDPGCKKGILSIRARFVYDDGEEHRAYYLPRSGSTVDFRHEGVFGRRPPMLYLEDLSQYSGKVLVFYSASGSGKTAEIAGSSVSRKSHLTIVLAPTDGAYKDENLRKEKGVTKTDIRNTEELTSLRDEIFKVAEAHKADFLEIMEATTEEDKLKLVVAIDEASQCQEFVRSIISDVVWAQGCVRERLFDVLESETTASRDNIDVAFSVAGTGASAATAGSIANAFEVLEPTYAKHYDMLREKLLRNVPKMLIPGGGEARKSLSSCIGECLPVVSVMMENGRMASISSSALREHPADDPIVESSLVEKIATKFIESNGLKDLVGDPARQHRVAAAAIAVHLFQGMSSKTLPETNEDYENVVKEMDFALPLATYITEGGDRINRIVSRFGLLEPNTVKSEQNWNPGAKIKKPFVMTASQQVIALYMLGVGLDNMLEASPYGFETLSTHLVKCAVAASLAVQEDDRPDLQKVLELIGFQVDDNSTSDSIKQVWTELKQCKAVGSKCEDIEGKEHVTVFQRTRQLQAELLIQQNKEKAEVLVVDKLLHKALQDLKPNPKGYFSPIACVNFGSSPFADGFITFYVEQTRTGNNSKEAKRFTIMNQSKDYHNCSSLDAKKLQQHAERGKHKLLDPLFGKFRLLCVSSSKKVLVAKRSCNKRDFLPYCADQSSLLKDLLTTLTNQRNRKERLQKYALCCDQEGKPIPESEWCQYFE